MENSRDDIPLRIAVLVDIIAQLRVQIAAMRADAGLIETVRQSTEEIGWTANRLMQQALNELLENCYDEGGEPQAPGRKAITEARAMLPKSFSMTLVREKKR